MDLSNVKPDLLEKGYTIIPNILSSDEIEYCKREFRSYQSTLPPSLSSDMNPHGIYKYCRAGHTRYAWFIRTRPNVQKAFQHIWNTDELIVSFDGSCYISPTNTTKDSLWTHSDQTSSSDLECYQGLVSLTDNSERTLIVYEGSHKLHESYAKLPAKKSTHWMRIAHPYLMNIKHLKKTLTIPAGSLAIWDSRTFHQNQYGYHKDDQTPREERMVQYVCYLPKTHPKNTKSMQKKRLKYFKDQRTTSHWPSPIRVNGLQPQTYGQPPPIDYDSLPINDLHEFHDEIMKLI